MAIEEELYQDHILDHYEDPYHRGQCSRCTHAHQDDNPLCGDRVRMELRIDDRGTMREVFFDGEGCCISQAAASMLVQRFDGRHIDEVKQFTANDMLELFGVRLTPNRQKCCLLPWRVLQAAIYSPVTNGPSAHRQRSGFGVPGSGVDATREVPRGDLAGAAASPPSPAGNAPPALGRWNSNLNPGP